VITRRQVLAASAGALAAGSARGDRRASAQQIPPGRILFVRNGDVWVWSLGGSEALLEDGQASDPRWSPDGTQMLFVRAGEGFSDLWLRTVGDGSEVRLTANEPAGVAPGSAEYAASAAWVDDPCWSTSGRIAFASDAGMTDRVMALWLMESSSAQPALAPARIAEDHISAISVDAAGTFAAYTARYTGRDGGFHTYVGLRDLATGETWSLSSDDEGAFDPAIPPEGRLVVFAARINGVSDLWLFDLDAGDRARITDQQNALKPIWSPDGTWLAYLRMVDRGFEAWAMPLVDGEAGAPVRLFAFDDIDATSGLAWTYL
jgi:Tol biopolymer transport system component